MNQEQLQLPELQIVCGVRARKLGRGTSVKATGQFESDLIEFLTSLHAHNGFDLPSADLIGGLHSFHSLALLVDAPEAGAIEFDSLKSFVQSFSELESLNRIMSQLDSPEFAIWCGMHNSRAREQLMNIRSHIDATVKRMRSIGCGIDTVVPADPMTIKNLRTIISQACLMGLHVDSVQLLWTSKIKSKKVKNWVKKLKRSGAGTVIARSDGSVVSVSEVRRNTARALKPGVLIEIDPTEFLYVMDFKDAVALDVSVGISENFLVLQLGEVRRFIQLPAACSRMQANSATLSTKNISIYFTIKEELWPNL